MNTALSIIALILVVQLVLFYSFVNAFIVGNNKLVSLDIGLILLGLGVAKHVYAVAPKQITGIKK